MPCMAAVMSQWARGCAKDTRGICRWDPAQPKVAWPSSVGQKLDFCSHSPSRPGPICVIVCGMAEGSLLRWYRHAYDTEVLW